MTSDSRSARPDEETHLYGVPQSFFVTPHGATQHMSPMRSPPPLKPSQGTPSAHENNENIHLLLPMIPDDFDDDYLFSTNNSDRPIRRAGLSFRPRTLVPAPYVDCTNYDTIFVDAKEYYYSSRTLMPLLDEQSQDRFELRMKPSRNGNPVTDRKC